MAEEIAPFKSTVKLIIFSLLVQIGAGLIIFIINLFRFDYLLVPNITTATGNFFTSLTLNSFLWVLVIDLLLIFYMVALTNRFMNQSQLSKLTVFVFLLLTIINRMYIYFVFRFELLFYSERISLVVAIGSVIIAIITIIFPLVAILQSISSLIIKRDKGPLQWKVKLLFALNFLLSIFMSFIISLPLVSILIYTTWIKGFSNIKI